MATSWGKNRWQPYSRVQQGQVPTRKKMTGAAEGLADSLINRSLVPYFDLERECVAPRILWFKLSRGALPEALVYTVRFNCYMENADTTGAVQLARRLAESGLCEGGTKSIGVSGDYVCILWVPHKPCDLQRPHDATSEHESEDRGWICGRHGVLVGRAHAAYRVGVPGPGEAGEKGGRPTGRCHPDASPGPGAPGPGVC